MSTISKPVEWDILNTPSVQPVQYYSLLKKKRELTQLIKQYDAQVLKQGYTHYCCIVPKNFSACLNNKYDIYILFLNEISNTSFIGFRIKTSKETFVHEINLLLLFLKKSKKTIFYLMNNNYIHVQCGINDAWELFYLLYGEYLRRYVFTVIGTQFFFSVASCHCIQKERQLLEMLYKGSKIVKISRKSVYYKLNHKRKISVTDLIHMTYNMPKTKKYALSCYNFKKPPLLQSCITKSLCATSHSKSVVGTWKTKMPFCSFSHGGVQKSALFEEIPVPIDPVLNNHTEPLIHESHECDNHLISHHTSLKRKFQETECAEHELMPTTSTYKLFKSSEIDLTEADQWEKYAVLNPHSIESYSDVFHLKKLVPELLNDKSKNLSSSTNSECNSQGHILIQNKILPSVSFPRDGVEEDNEFALQSQIHKSKESAGESLLTARSQCDTKIKFPMTGNGLENFNQDSLDMNDVGFTTGAGKTISISNDAMLTAHKLMNDMFAETKEITCESSDPLGGSKILQKAAASNNIGSVIKKRTTDINMPLSVTSGVQLLPKLGCLESNKNFRKSNSAVLENIENVSKNCIESLKDVGFTTAGGKDIIVSNSAMQAAQKIIQGMLTEDDEQTSIKVPKTETHKSRSSSIFQDVDCSSKKAIVEGFDDEDMDKILVEKFFEDTPFDDKELEIVVDDDKSKVLSTILEPAKESNPVARKVRKSLGGRRSFRYSDKL